MGLFLSKLKNSSSPSLNPLLHNSISKLREYHGSFKSVCDTFSIDLTEYEQIFGTNETMFQSWDTDNNGLINALELFSGLIIFSETQFEEKARFLFDLFDFNELNSLSLIDLEFLLLSCANATYKILNISAEVNEDDISSFLKNYFAEDTRINISQLLKWCIKTTQVAEFFTLIQKEQPELRVQVAQSNVQQKINALQQVFSKEFGKRLLLPEDPRPFFEYRPLASVVNSKSYNTMIEWIGSLVKKVFIQPTTLNRDVKVSMNWVYGFRGKDVRRPLAAIKVKTGEKARNEKLLFFTACVVIIYYPKLNEQKHYLEHDNEIICLSVANNLSLIASGEYAEYPAIHIWDSSTLQSLGVIKGVHQKGVNLIQFFSRDELVASCGLRANSPIFVHNIKDFSLVLSTCVNDFAIDLLTIRNYVGTFESKPTNPFSDFESSFVVCTLKQLLLFQYFKGHFVTKEVNFELYEIESPMTCATSLRINLKAPYLKAYQAESSIVVLSGHQDGSVYLWENFETVEDVVKYKDSIVCITAYEYGIIIGTDASTIHLWDFTFKNNIKNMDLSQFGFKLFSYCISDIVVAGDKILVCTTEGDIVEVFLQQKQKHDSNAMVSKVRANRINYISQLSGQLNALCTLERIDSEDKLVFTAGSSAAINGFSHETHEIIDVWSVGDQITAMDCTSLEDGGTVFAIGTQNGRIYLRIDWEESPKWYDCKQQVNDLRFAGDSSCLVSASNDAFIYIFFLNNNSYLQLTPKKLHFEGEIPICLYFVDDCKSFIVGTSMKNQYKVELPDLKSKNLLQDNEKLNSTIWTLRYPMVHKEDKVKREVYYPLVLGADVKVFLAAGEGGYIYFWRDREQLENNSGGYLRGHASNVSRLIMAKSQDMFYSVGASDNTLIEWKVDFINDDGDFSKPFTDTAKQFTSFQSGAGISRFSVSVQSHVQALSVDEIFKREKDYCYFLNNISDKLKDNFVLFRATNQKMLNGLLQELVDPFDKKNQLQKRSPPLSLQLDYVYGFLAYDKRRTLFYVHYYDTLGKKKNTTNKVVTQQPTKKLNGDDARKKLEHLQQQSVMLPAHFQKEMLFAQQTLLNYDEQHQDCSRQFVYITSRIAVVYNPLTNQQRFYEGHRFKITCLAVHPMKCFVATGECALKPTIHIWNVFNMEPMKIIKTNHSNGIYDIVFSRDSSLIVSIGIDEFFSIQVTNWKTEAILGFRNSGPQPICAVTFNPYNKYEVTTAGYQNVTVWNVRNLMRVRVVSLQEEGRNSTPQTVTCLSYISYLLGDHIESDIIVGTNSGDLALIACGKYIVVKEKAHSKMINCLKITEILGDKVVIVTSGEDEFVRVWDTKFNLINEVNMRKTGFYESTMGTRNVSVQSLDVFSCRFPRRQSKEGEEQQSLSVLLLGTRNGDIIEAAFEGEFAGIKSDEVAEESEESAEEDQEDSVVSSPNQPFSLQDQLKFNFSIYIRAHQSQVYDSKQQIDFFNKKLFFTMHPTHPVMVTVGDDQKLMIWDTQNNVLLLVRNLGMSPSAIKFSPDGELLVIGYQVSMVMVLDSKMQRNPLGKVSERYLLPSLDILMSIKDKETKTAVLSIEFSAKGDMLAISYDNAKNQKDVFDSKLGKEGSFISVYMNKASHKTSQFRGSEKNLYVKYTDIRCPSIYESYNTDTDAFGVSVYFMTFSEDGDYLLIYYQLVNNQQTRINNDPQGVYIVWDLNSNTSVKNWDNIKNIRWRYFNFPNSMNAQYQFYESLIGLPNDSPTLANSVMKVPVMSVMMDLPPFLACGSTNGDLHMVKQSCLYYDKDFVNEISKKQMCLAKTYPAHVSFVNQIESHANAEYIFTSGVLDECIFKWKLTEEQYFSDLDNHPYEKKQTDLWSELISKDKFKNLYNELLPLRANTSEKLRNIDDTRQPEVELKLSRIIGRKAFNRRNNLFYDFDERLLYIAGSNLIITTLEDDEAGESQKKFKGYKQEFVKLDVSSDAPEISCITLSNDKKLLCAGTIETKAKLLIWDISSRTSVRQITLNNASMVMNVKFAYDNRHMCCNVITNEYTMMIYLIDTDTSSVLGATNFTYTIPFKIKDLEFHPNSVFRFVSCGIQHMAQWKFCGSSLTHSAMEIENPKDLVELQQNKAEEQEPKEEEEEREALKVSFLTIIFVQDVIVTSGEDGFIYVWDDVRIMKKQKAHPDSSILSLHTTRDSSLFVSGGMDGRIILWYLGLSEYAYIVEKIYEYSITTEELSTAILNPRNHIQSVCIGSKYILAGTRSGDIYELVRPNEQDLKSLTKVNNEMVKLRMNCIDHELPRVVAFSGNSLTLYSITQKGLFCAWDLSSLKRIYMKHFYKDTLSMIVCKLTPKIFIAFEQEIIVLNSHNESYTINPRFQMKQKTAISDTKLSFDEKMLAVALTRNQEQNAKFEIYDTANEDNNFKLLFSIDNLNATIEYLDFSTDNFYVLYKDVNDEIAIIDLSQQKHINTLYVEFDIEWCSDGIKMSEKVKGVHSCYTDENRILKITPIGEKSIAVTDEMGTLRIFSYPCPQGQGYMKLYTDHLNYINQCVASPDRESLVTTSEMDRCIMIWKVVKNEQTGISLDNSIQQQ